MSGTISIAFTVNEQQVHLQVPPLLRLLDILRDHLGLTGTKEGCGEGECGACAVLLNDLLVNACLVPAIQLDGCRVKTIEGLGQDDCPDPIQTAFVEAGAVQCGFCFPGMVLATRFLLDNNPVPSRQQIRRGLAGNLCRCTGYERIIQAVESIATSATDSAWGFSEEPDNEVSPAPEELSPGLSAALGGRKTHSHLPGPAVKAIFPDTLHAALAMLANQDQTVNVIAGATDFLTSVKLGTPVRGSVLSIIHLAELSGISQTNGFIEIGTCTTFTDLLRAPLIARYFPALIECSAQMGAVAIQNRATVGGNIISASPAADSPPVLMALGAKVRLVATSGSRDIPLSEFYTGYRQTVKRADELLHTVLLPIPSPAAKQVFYKVATRSALAIAKVSLAASAEIDSAAAITNPLLSAGSVAAVPVLLPKTQRFLASGPASGEDIAMTRARADFAAEAGRIAAAEVKPIDDVRSTARYRQMVVGELVRRFVQQVLS